MTPCARLPLALVAAAAALVAGCGSSPPTHFYTLSAGAPAASASAPATNARRVVIISTTVPAAVDRPQVVLRDGAGRVTFSEFHQWAAPPRSAIAGAVAAQLSRELGGAEVWPSPVAAPTDADVRILLNVTRFDGALGESADIEVLWTLRSGATERTGRTAARESVTGAADYGALAAAYARALNAVSRDLAAAIRALPPPAR